MTNNIENKEYQNLLKQYIENKETTSTCQIQKLSDSLKRQNLLPEEIIALHNESLLELSPHINEEFKHSMNFLLQTMIAYKTPGPSFKRLISEGRELKSEIEIAASMQKTILETTIPEIPNLDIGAISVPAEQMNGDYYQFFTLEDQTLGIALADVIGKGVPAALCMSMIKYSMDSFSMKAIDPSMTLKYINRVVNRNIDSSMFVTMFYAQYFPLENKLKYASAGHEPGFYYSAVDNKFYEIKTEGIVLGVFPNTTYKQYEQQLLAGDMIVLLTDGVTEHRVGEEFMSQEELLNIIEQYAHLDAQSHVNAVYNHFKTIKKSEFKDDFTFIILKQKV